MAALLALCLVWASGGEAHAGPALQEYTYAECSRVDEASLRAEVESLVGQVLATEGSSIDVASVVDRKWAELGVGAVLDAEIDAAVGRVRAESRYWDRFLSGWSAGKAEVLAARVADQAFASEAFHGTLDELAEAVAAELAREVESVAAASASTALLCMQQYVGERYSTTLYQLFEREIHDRLSQVDYANAAESTQETPVAISALTVHGKALTGVGVIVASQITRRVAVALSQRVAGRVAGKVAGRVLGRLGSSIIPVAGWVIGAGLIAWDLIEGADGALPQIQAALQSAEVHAAVRAEIASAVRDGLNEEMESLAAAVTASVVDEWRQFCVRHPHLCSLPPASPEFKQILDQTPLAEIDHLSGLVDAFMDVLGQEALESSLQDGRFGRLLDLSPAALALLRATGSTEETLAWAAMAGDRLDAVVEQQIYTRRAPGDLDRATLQAMIGLQDADPAGEALARLLVLEPEASTQLLALPADRLLAIVAATSAEELTWLASHLATLSPAAADDVSARLARGAITVDELAAPPAVLPAMLRPASQREAADATQPISVASTAAGRSHAVLWAAGWILAALVAVALIALLARRLGYGGR